MTYAPDLKTLRAFVTVAREGNVTRAARLLRLTQPAISLQLKRLGEGTGLTLFHRTAAGLELTEDGAALATKAEQVLATAADFGQTARRLTGQARGRLRIGTIIDPEFTRLGAFLNALVMDAPGMETELRHGMSGDVPVRLLRDELDVGYFLGDIDDFVHDADASDGREALFHVRALAPLTYRVVAPPALGAMVRGRDWDELAALPWIGTPPLSVHNRLLSRRFEERGVRQNVVALVDQEPSMLAMARTGVGLSLCRESIALHERQVGALVIADRVQVDTSLSMICLAARRGDPNVALAFGVIAGIWRGAEG